MFKPINFKQWIDDHRDLLKPPVGNATVWQDREFIIMVVGGPNRRTDYHLNAGEEFFYQIEGDMNLKVIDHGNFVDMPIRAGEIYLLPPNVPHSPRRPAGTVGLVIERIRRPGELDGFQWFCEKCSEKLYEEFVEMRNIVKDLPPIFDRFWGDKRHFTCRKCGFEMKK